MTDSPLMDGFVSDSLAEGVALVGSALGSTVFTLVGIVAEYAGIQSLAAGHSTVGAWEVWLGAVALFVGVYLLGYREFRQRLVERRSQLRN